MSHNVKRATGYPSVDEWGIRRESSLGPCSCRVTGNDEADALARLTRASPNVDIHLNKTLSDCYNTIEKFILNEWQIQWDVDPVSLHYHMVQLVVGRKCKFAADENKHVEKCISRLKLGKCLLNSFMHKINVHLTGLSLI